MTNPPPVRKVLLSAYVGTALEYYDFYIYATAASLVFQQVFFPEMSPFLGLATAFATYGVGYFVRPLGGLLFGHLGDRRGRKNVLVLTLLGTGTVTFLIALVPGYDVLGVWAAFLLIGLRLVQGLFLGGEWGGAITYVLENAPRHRRTFFGAFTQMGSPSGLLLANLVFLSLGGMSDDSFQRYGWRIPFVLGVVLLAVGLLIRVHLQESPEFEDGTGGSRAAGGPAPVATLFRAHKRGLFFGILLTMAPSGPFWLMNVFLVGYLTTNQTYDRSHVLLLPIAVAITQLVLILPLALLIDRYDARRVTTVGAGAAAVFAFPVFLIAGSEGPYGLLLLLVVLSAAATNVVHVATGSLVPLQFPVAARYSGAALVYNVALGIGGGLIPVLAALSVDRLDGSPVGASVAASVIALLGVVGVVNLRNTVNEKHRTATPDEPSEVSGVRTR